MNQDTQAEAVSMLATIPDLLRNPGEWLWQRLAEQSPAIAAQLTGGTAEPDAVVLSVLSALCWTALALVLLALPRLVRAAVRTVQHLLAAAVHRVVEFVAGLRTRIVCRRKRQSLQRRVTPTISDPVDLDELDLAVLYRGAGLAPGFAISIPELAEHLQRRPGQVQRSLDKLYDYQLVNPLLGSTDGYGNYCLTDSGAWFIASHRRSTGRSPPVARRPE